MGIYDLEDEEALKDIPMDAGVIPPQAKASPMAFDQAQMLKDMKDAQSKRDLFGALGNVAQGFSNIPTSYEMLYGGKVNRPDIKGTFDSLAKSVEDPSKRQAKLFKAQKDFTDNQVLKKQQDDDIQARDPMSRQSKSAVMFAKSRGIEVEPGVTSYHDVMQMMDPKKINEKEAEGNIDFNKNLKLAQFNKNAISQEKALDRANDLEKIQMKQKLDSGKKEFESLPKDNQELILGLSKKNADKIAISNQIDSVIKDWEKMTDDQKVTQGRQLLKTLNSTEGKDAVGAEEANRLGSKLEFAIGNMTNSNPTQFGRDLKGFHEQAMMTSNAIKNATKENQKIIDQAYGSVRGNSPVYDYSQNQSKIPERTTVKSLAQSMVPSAHANNNSGPSVVKKLRNNVTGKVKYILSDGSEIEE